MDPLEVRGAEEAEVAPRRRKGMVVVLIMAEKCTILCADHRCKHNCPGSYYGTCQHPDHANLVAYGGITRMYMETCPRNEPLPPNAVRMGSMPRMYCTSVRSGKSLLTSLYEDTADLMQQADIPVTFALDKEFEFTEEDVWSAIEQFQHLKPLERDVYLHGEWGGHIQIKED